MIFLADDPIDAQGIRGPLGQANNDCWKDSNLYAAVVQLDRTIGYEPIGCEFESCLSYQISES